MSVGSMGDYFLKAYNTLGEIQHELNSNVRAWTLLSGGSGLPVGSPLLPYRSVTLGRLLKFSFKQFLHLYNEPKNSPLFTGLSLRLNEIMHIKKALNRRT